MRGEEHEEPLTTGRQSASNCKQMHYKGNREVAEEKATFVPLDGSLSSMQLEYSRCNLSISNAKWSGRPFLFLRTHRSGRTEQRLRGAALLRGVHASSKDSLVAAGHDQRCQLSSNHVSLLRGVICILKR